MRIIIPAREGSKGLPFKNRKLFKYTAESIPYHLIQDVWVTTDDLEIKQEAQRQGFNDTANIRDVMVHTVDQIHPKLKEPIVMLYLTYPKRTWETVHLALKEFYKYSEMEISNSLLCRKEIATSPYLYLKETGEGGLFGKQLTEHDLYRRQDYPTCFEICHEVAIFNRVGLIRLNKNMYCDSTIFFRIPGALDIDTPEDFKKLDAN